MRLSPFATRSWKPTRNCCGCRSEAAKNMTEGEIFEVLRASLWGAAMMGLPILATTLVVGFVIGLLQALTSIQEMTLTFIPKILAVIIVFFLSLGYMTKVALDLFNNWVLPLIAG